jgi:hypothetical protein
MFVKVSNITKKQKGDNKLTETVVVTKEKFYQKTWFIILMLLIFFPVGLILMWATNKWNIGARIGVSIVFVGLAILGTMGNNSQNNATQSQPTSAVQPTSTQSTQTPAPAPAPTPAPEPPKNKPAMSKAEFDQIQNGMTYEQVTAIIGGSGEMMSEVGSKGDQFYTVIYQYEGEGDFGANANLTFQGSKLQMKAQFGLK